MAMTRWQIQSDEGDRVAFVIKAAISSEIRRLELSLEKTERQIEKFENAFKISSGYFLEHYTAEDMKDGDKEYIQWAGELKIRECIQEDLNRLRNIEYASS
jgi:hypothetical protein